MMVLNGTGIFVWPINGLQDVEKWSAYARNEHCTSLEPAKSIAKEEKSYRRVEGMKECGKNNNQS